MGRRGESGLGGLADRPDNQTELDSRLFCQNFHTQKILKNFN